ncbi:hypothetical protein AURDEDRAFT_137113 [Auricularia subglabra TFB-10046 SS5]|nr:hypothetical protein AURDEDRAFT_137113 [Auricularia subglabra TFB-10046 SS5]
MASNAASTSASAQKTRDIPKSIPLDWWDFQSDSARRPVAWSRSCVQFSAHDSQAQVIGCVFPSRQTFALPIPQPILSAPLSYAPPTILSTSVPLRDEWETLFAYFPPRPGGMHVANDAEAGGVGCVYYNQSGSADAWIIAQFWYYQHNGGAVAARWIHEERQWTCQDGQLARAPRLGPQTHLTNPTLAVVTQAHTLCIYYRVVPRGANLSFKMFAASLKAIDHREENKPPPPQTAFDKGIGLRLCKRAAIGMGYNEDSIIIAMHSTLMPSCPPPASAATDLALSVAPAQTHALEPYAVSENEISGDESSVELCEVRLLVHRQPPVSSIISMQVVQTFPLTPISNVVQDVQLTSLTFVPRPPAQAEALSDTRMFLAIASMDYSDYSSGLKSRVALYAIKQNAQGNRFGYFKGPPQHPRNEAASMKAPLWVHSLVASVDFPNADVQGVAVSVDVCDLHNVYVATVNPNATYRACSARGAAVGETIVLRVPNLASHPQRKATPLYGAIAHSLITLPLSTKLSTNEVLLASVPPWSGGMVHHPPTVHPFASPTTSHAEKLACALLNRHSCADVVHALRSQTLTALEETLMATSALLDAHSAAVGFDPAMLQAELVRAAVEVYHRREETEARYKAGLDLCYLIGCASMFDACGEDDAWDLNAVWQLVAAMKWVIGLVERVARECVYLEGEMLLAASQRTGAGDSLVKPDPDAPPPTPTNPHPLFFLLLHPLPVATLLDVLKNIESFHLFVTSSSTRTDNAYIARQSVIDCVQLSPLNIGELKTGLENLLVDVEAMNVDHRRRSLCMLAPAPELYAQLPILASRLTSPNLVDKPRLFYESTPSASKGKAVLSVLTRMPLEAYRVCGRCGGRAEPFTHALVMPIQKNADKSVRLEAWLKQWNARCLCGGRWMKA